MAQQEPERSRGENIARGEEAAHLLNGPIFAAAYDNARDLFIKDWEKADNTVQQRELCWAKVQGLKEVQRQLRRIIGQGNTASRLPDER